MLSWMLLAPTVITVEARMADLNGQERWKGIVSKGLGERRHEEVFDDSIQKYWYDRSWVNSASRWMSPAVSPA